MRYICLLFLISLPLLSCGYHLVGMSNALPEEIQSIYVPTFENSTGQPELEQRLTSAVANELIARGRYQVTDSEENADAVLNGTIMAFSLAPTTLDEEGRAVDYKVTISISVILNQKGQKEPVWKNPTFVFREDYTVGTEAQDYYDRLYQAVDDLSQAFARSLITSILEGF